MIFRIIQKIIIKECITKIVKRRKKLKYSKISGCFEKKEEKGIKKTKGRW